MKYPIKELSLAIGVLIVGLLALTASGAQEVKTVAGVVKGVDVEKQSLRILEDATGQEFTFKVEKTTVITKGGQTIALADVQAGDKVEVMLEQGQVKTVKVK